MDFEALMIMVDEHWPYNILIYLIHSNSLNKILIIDMCLII